MSIRELHMEYPGNQRIILIPNVDDEFCRQDTQISEIWALFWGVFYNLKSIVSRFTSDQSTFEFHRECPDSQRIILIPTVDDEFGLKDTPKAEILALFWSVF